MQFKDLPMVASSHKTTPKDHLEQKASASQGNSPKLLQRKNGPFRKRMYKHLGGMFERQC